MMSMDGSSYLFGSDGWQIDALPRKTFFLEFYRGLPPAQIEASRFGSLSPSKPNITLAR